MLGAAPVDGGSLWHRPPGRRAAPPLSPTAGCFLTGASASSGVQGLARGASLQQRSPPSTAAHWVPRARRGHSGLSRPAQGGGLAARVRRTPVSVINSTRPRLLEHPSAVAGRGRAWLGWDPAGPPVAGRPVSSVNGRPQLPSSGRRDESARGVARADRGPRRSPRQRPAACPCLPLTRPRSPQSRLQGLSPQPRDSHHPAPRCYRVQNPRPRAPRSPLTPLAEPPSCLPGPLGAAPAGLRPARPTARRRRGVSPVAGSAHNCPRPYRVCGRVFCYTRSHAHTYTQAHTCTQHTHTHMQAHTHEHTCTHSGTHTHRHTRAHTHNTRTHAHTQAPAARGLAFPHSPSHCMARGSSTSPSLSFPTSHVMFGEHLLKNVFFNEETKPRCCEASWDLIQ